MSVVEDTREMPGGLFSERELLEGWLEYYRATLLHKCAGLTGEQLVARSCAPSPMSLMGLVRHMTEMERAYAHIIADPDIEFLYSTDDNPDADFEDVVAAHTTTDLATYVEHCARSREIMAGHRFGDVVSSSGRHTLRWFYLYLIKEYARHLGHADLLRERIDGLRGE